MVADGERDAKRVKLETSSGEKDVHMWEYAVGQTRGADPFDTQTTVDPLVKQAVEWVAARSPDRVKELREKCISKIEEADKELRASGLAEQWFGGADSITKRVAGAANGYLLERLLVQSGYTDVDCVNLLRKGSRTIVRFACFLARVISFAQVPQCLAN